jgi:HemY protein
VSSRAVDFATEQGSIQAWQWLLPLWPQFASLDVAEQEQLVLTAEAALPHLDGAGLALIEQNQRQYPDSSYLLYLAGQACMQRGLWGKASQFLTLAKPGLHGALLKRRCWIALARLAQERGDTRAALQAWQQAATVV